MPVVHAQSEPEAPRDVARFARPWLRAAILLYGVLALACVYLRLRGEGFTRDAWGHALTVLYIEALSFLAVFGGAALIIGLLQPRRRDPAGPRRRRRRRRGASDPLDSNTLAGIERLRGR